MQTLNHSELLEIEGGLFRTVGKHLLMKGAEHLIKKAERSPIPRYASL